MMKRVRPRFTLYAVVLLLTFFQNCGQVSIEMASIEPPKPFALTNMAAEGCVNSVKMEPEKTKFIFVIDLSRSNIGDFYKGNYNYNSNMLPGYYFFDQDKATDPLGARFDSISDFVNTCGQSTRNDYAIIAFSNTAGEISQTGPDYKLNCTDRFITSGEVATQLTMMKDAQAKETIFYSQFIEPNTPYLAQHATQAVPLIYKETNYVAATDCISSTIEKDMISPTNDTSNYQIFFLSDGEAYAKSTNCEEPSVTNKIKCYIDKMDENLSYMMKLSSAKSKPIRIHALYYTRNGNPNLAIENYMNYLSSIGQTVSPINLGSFQNTTSGTTENPFCNLIAVDKSIVYRTNKIFAVNTDVLKVGKELKFDSDRDGILDEDEYGFGADPANPRSMVPEILDGICKIIGDKTLCQYAFNQITCNKNLVNGFGMNDCDIKILKLDQVAFRPELAGIDTDNDGIPDYVEILKGLSPMNPDSYLDPDIDGMNNLQEISLGLDPNTPDTPADAVVFSTSTFKDQINQCTSGGWHLDINSLGGRPGTNNLLLFFRTESKNTQGLFEYRKFDSSYQLKVQPDSTFTIELFHSFVNVTDFELVTLGSAL